MNMLEKFSHITAFVFDVDGVMTDGSLIIMPGGEFLRTMNVKDGYALQLAVKKGYKVIVMSGATSQPVIERMKYLGVTDVHMGIKDKKALLHQLLTPEEIKTTLFMGDDMPDLPLMGEVYLPCCPADAAIHVREAAAYVSHLEGGKGCVRDVVEKVMTLQGKWGSEEQVAAI